MNQTAQDLSSLSTVVQRKSSRFGISAELHLSIVVQRKCYRFQISADSDWSDPVRARNTVEPTTLDADVFLSRCVVTYITFALSTLLNPSRPVIVGVSS